ncbi:protein RTF2 homolog [Fopius arisanus]|uniref:Replication termination factor 2 n=1 Tax=Fopius arisanus TaxID=64838 RepID=A0A9R1TPD3_9HYME|nr:PREDICTED: protein RTF2 homolog [Fopius arisanus]
MGCDGGTIPRRDELVRIRKKPEQKDREAELAFRWRHCTIRQLPLQPPIVACSLGKLYSKEAVIEGLLDRSTLPESAVHIKGLKDIKPLNLTPNPAYDATKAETGDGYVDGGKSPFICPVIGLEMNGKYKFCFLWTCGCVMSERALKEVKSSVCHRCQKPFESSDIVTLNAEGEDLKRMEDNAAARKLSKKSKKRQTSEDAPATEESSSKPKKLKIKKEGKAGPSRAGAKIQDPAFKKTKDNYSVAKDPAASEVLKSIFTSHKTAAEQTRAHWVTYNPFYN